MKQSKDVINALIKDTREAKIEWTYTKMTFHLPRRPGWILTTSWKEMRVSFAPYDRILTINGLSFDMSWYQKIVLSRLIDGIYNKKRKSEKKQQLRELLDGITFRD